MSLRLMGIVALLSGSGPLKHFEDFEIARDTNATKTPSAFTLSEGVWRNSAGKLVRPVEVNLGSHHYLTVNGCGTGCRFYSLFDLSTGRENRFTTRFDRPEGSKSAWVSDVITRAGSRLIIEQQHEFDGDRCREWLFEFDVKTSKVHPLNGRALPCRAL